MKLLTLLRILKRAKVLAGLTKSKTTQAQYAAVFACALLIAALGYFVPVFAVDSLDEAVFLALVGVVVPLVSRMIGYQEKAESDADDGHKYAGTEAESDAKVREYVDLIKKRIAELHKEDIDE